MCGFFLEAATENITINLLECFCFTQLKNGQLPF